MLSGTENSRRQSVLTDLTIQFETEAHGVVGSAPDVDGIKGDARWLVIEKDLYLHGGPQRAWLRVAVHEAHELETDDLVVTDIHVGASRPDGADDEAAWESRPGDIWLRRARYGGGEESALAAVDVLFGGDAIDPRPGWHLSPSSIRLPDACADRPEPRLTIRRSSVSPLRDDVAAAKQPLKAGAGGKFRIVQIADTHMVTGPGMCTDAMDADGRPMAPFEADPQTTEFIGRVLDRERPDLVVLTGDQLHHGIPDSQSALFKVVAPLIRRRVPYAYIFGNHDSEGDYALSRDKQMAILQGLPFNLSETGPDDVAGVGNFCLPVYGPSSSGDESTAPSATLYFLDSHGDVPSQVKNPDYDPVHPSQIAWFTSRSRELRAVRELDQARKNGATSAPRHLSLVFLHIPLPEYADDTRLTRAGGQRGEPTEGPSVNTHLYQALAEEGVAAVGCGHDHVNDFCALLSPSAVRGSDPASQGAHTTSLQPAGPWLCYGGCGGYGAYSAYSGKRYHRRARVWELDVVRGDLSSWKRVEYAEDRVDEIMLIQHGEVVVPSPTANRERRL